MKNTPQLDWDGLPPIVDLKTAIISEEEERQAGFCILRKRLVALATAVASGGVSPPFAMVLLIAIESAMEKIRIERASLLDRIKVDLRRINESERESLIWTGSGSPIHIFTYSPMPEVANRSGGSA